MALSLACATRSRVFKSTAGSNLYSYCSVAAPDASLKLLDGFSRYYAGQTIAVHEAGRSKTMDLQRHHAAEEHS